MCITSAELISILPTVYLDDSIHVDEQIAEIDLRRAFFAPRGEPVTLLFRETNKSYVCSEKKRMSLFIGELVSFFRLVYGISTMREVKRASALVLNAKHIARSKLRRAIVNCN